MAHINFTTQALIAAWSKAKYYDPQDKEEHISDLDVVDCDELGLVWAISVKVQNF